MDWLKVPPARKCGRCGKPQHKLATNCAALDKTCNKCHKIGRFASQEDLYNGHLYSIHAMRGLGQAPRVPVLKQRPNGSAKLNVLPDSGADISAADVTALKQLGEDVDNLLPSQQDNAYTVNGSCLRSVGQMTIQITLGEVTISETLYIFPIIPGRMLISWKTAQKLRILSDSYPTQISATKSKTRVTAEDFFESFPLFLTAKCGSWMVRCFAFN